MKVFIKKYLEETYTKCSYRIEHSSEFIVPYIRRFIRFLALPYCYFFLINWQECTISKFRVINDLLYIFFKLKYYPYNYSLSRLWEKDRSVWKFYYGSIYEPYQRQMLSKEVQRREYRIIFDDKEVCYQICSTLKIALPNQFGCIDPGEDYLKKIQDIVNNSDRGKVIIKPVRGAGGKDIVIAFKKEDQILIRKQNCVLTLNVFKLESRSVVQEYLEQHSSFSKFSGSFNTMRIVTLLTRENNVIIIGALMRFGVGDAYIDNTSSGGIAVGINLDTGELNGIGYDFNCNTFKYHPTSRVVFTGFIIPCWNEVINLAQKTQKQLSYYKLLGLDIGITPDGPVLIEINSAHDNVGLEQSYGPILKNKIVLDECHKYNLIVNNMFK
ncbi:MAG: sugar-transfer associated ATP-grasp domain-containing protein [Geobacteraceae bacterium]|nr:sugar-transfer associated ATP-grasp domain-containing protein [Geobacteraceae bacterium]